jgi:hypothetical protein
MMATWSSVELADRPVGRDAGAGIGGGACRLERADRHQVARMRHAHQVGVAAGQLDAQVAHRASAQVLVATLAHQARAAAQPGIDDDLVAELHALHVGADFDDLTADLVAHRHRQLGAGAFERGQLAPAHVEAAGLHMQVGMAHAAVRDAQRHLVADGRRQFVGNFLQVTAP